MLFRETEIEDVWLVEAVPIADERGSFARTFCGEEFARHGLEHRFVQHSMSVSHRRHTLRGLHFQEAPSEEVKIVRCAAGAIWDVAVDLRPQSPAYLRWTAVELSAENMRALYIPKGFAHGFLSLEDESAVSYLISAPYDAARSAGIRYDDPAIGIRWPARPNVLSERDRNLPFVGRPRDPAQPA